MASTALSIPFFTWRGFAPAATDFRPSFTMACARTVAVVVPSPAMSLVLLATSRTNCAPIFSNGFSTSISLAMVTPSLMMLGLPYFFSSTTLRPRGPSVTLTASASVLTPRSRARRASSSNSRIFPAIPLLLLDRQHVVLAQNYILFPADFDLCAAVLCIDDTVAGLDFQRLHFAVIQGLA